MKPSTGWPFTKANTVGSDWMPSWPGIAGWLSVLSLTSLTLPLAALTTFSSTGVSCLQGLHQSAQKSTSTGWRFDSSITSFMNVWVVVSLIRPSSAAEVGACNMVGQVLPGSRLPRRRLEYQCVCNQIVPEPGVCNVIPGSGRHRNRLDPRPVSRGFQEFNKIVARKRGGHGVA